MKNSKLNEYDARGRGVLNINVFDDNNFLSPYSPSSVPIINQEVASFLEETAKPYSTKTEFKINIHSDCITPEEQVKYRAGIRNYFERMIVATNINLKRNAIISLIMLALSIVFLGTMAVMILAYDMRVIRELVTIIGWVFAWEAVDYFALKRTELKIKKKREKALFDAEIEFYSLEK